MCNDGDLRLGGSSSVSSEGRVEICIGETWGTICDNSWDNNDATVACRALGFSAIGEWSPRKLSSICIEPCMSLPQVRWVWAPPSMELELVTSS